MNDEKLKLFRKKDIDQWNVNDPHAAKELFKVRNDFDRAKMFMLPLKTVAVQELFDESQFFKQQLFNEVRRTIMLDYLFSREHFIDIGE